MSFRLPKKEETWRDGLAQQPIGTKRWPNQINTVEITPNFRPQGCDLEMCPSHSEINEMFRLYRANLKYLVGEGEVEYSKGSYRVTEAFALDGWMYLPLRAYERTRRARGYPFTRKDITYAQQTIKELKRDFIGLHDWNNLTTLTEFLRVREVEKPNLIAQIIMGAWTYDRED